MKTVEFTAMRDGTNEDYQLLREHEHSFLSLTADRLLRLLAEQEDETLEGYKVTRLEHALQAATRAHREGADVDWVVAAVLHDIGDGLAPQNHDEFAASIVKPFVREEVTWTVQHHGLFQMVYYAHFYGWNRNEREKYKDHPYYQTCVDFCERWDQSSFDPDYPTEKLEFFAPLVKDVFARKAYDPVVLQPGIAKGLFPDRASS